MGAKESNNINDLNNNSPFFPGTELNGGTPCYRIDKDNKIIFNYEHFEKDYKKLNESIEEFKNLFKTEGTDDLQLNIHSLKKFGELIKDQEILEEYNLIINNYKSHFMSYFNSFKEMYKLVKETFESNQNYIKNWLKTQNNFNTIDEINRENLEKDKINNIYKLYHKFNEEIQSIDNILIEKLKIPKNKEKQKPEINMQDLKKQYENENTNDNINKMFSFQNHVQFLSFVNSIVQLRDYFEGRNIFLNKFIDVYNNMCNLYCEILKQIPNANDRVDIMNEINQYFGIIFKHRFIRHIQIKLEELEKIKVE